MKRIEKTIEVQAPVRAVYNQWTQFEEFPRFMKGVKSVRQLDDTHLHWQARVGGKDLEWDAEIVDQVPDQSISWRSVNGDINAGAVHFDKIDENHTRIHLAIELQPDTLVEKAGTAVGVPSWRVENDLENFKEMIESRGGIESGAWRGEAHSGRTTSRH